MSQNAEPITVPSTGAVPTQDMILQLVQGVIGVLGLVGVAVPPIFTSLAVEQQIAGLIAVIASLAWAAYSRLVTKPAEVHAAAVASAAAKAPRRVL
jgi:hypothetical protein